MSGNELLLLDGERADLRFSWYNALTECIHWGIELPIISHVGGYFDGSIEKWHNFFGLPNANRDEVEQDKLSVFYQSEEQMSVDMGTESSSLGDVHLQLGKRAECEGWTSFGGNLDQRLGVKLPTGDPNALAGSGAADFYFDVTSPDLIKSDRGGFRATLGVIILGASELPVRHEPLAAYGTAVFGWQLFNQLELVIQADWHTPLFDSDLRELGTFSSQLTFGGRLRIPTGQYLDIALQEDIVPDTAPDVGLVMTYRHAF